MDVKARLDGFKTQIDKITRSRTPIQLRAFVVGQYPSRYFQYRQILIECGEKWNALESAQVARERSKLDRRLIELEIQELSDKFAHEAREIEKERLGIKISQARLTLKENERNDAVTESAMTGALKEVLDLMEMAETEYADMASLDEEALGRLERDYWIIRFGKQCAIDLAVTGTITHGNLASVMSLPEDMQRAVLIEAQAARDRLAQTNQDAFKLDGKKPRAITSERMN